MLHLYLFYCNLSLKNRSWSRAAMLFRQRPIFHHAYVMHSAISCLHVLELPNDVQIADRLLVVAICYFDWLCSHKYGTVWYHPAISSFYITVFILCQFQGKLSGTLRIRQRVLSQLCSACCVLDVRCWFYVNTNHKTITNTHKHLMSCQSHRAMCLLLCMRLLIGRHHATV
jgi:hypothetical protein